MQASAADHAIRIAHAYEVATPEIRSRRPTATP